MFGANNIKNLRASELRDRLVMILSGKAAESHVFDGDSSTGASDDLDRATLLAKGIVKNFAMNGIKYTIDSKESKIKVQKELINAETRANNLVKKYNKTLYDIANELMIHETLNTDKLNILLANSDLETKQEPYSPNKVMNDIMNDFRKIRDKNINKDVVKTRGDRRKQALVLLLILILPNI